MVKINTCVFISGNGTNLKRIISKSIDYNFPINVKLVVSNTIKAKGLNFAKKMQIPFFIFNNKNILSEQKILLELKKKNISLILLAGYMKILSKKFVRSYGKKILNIHPSLLPRHKGLNTYQKVLDNKDIKTGCTVHLVNDKLDSGKIILKKAFFINSNDDIKSLKDKTQKLEYKAYSEAIIKYLI
tara:strand:+ start:128 stop:685 length:558 start_codon:yes stop_codon:yes gene_type:complete